MRLPLFLLYLITFLGIIESVRAHGYGFQIIPWLVANGLGFVILNLNRTYHFLSDPPKPDSLGDSVIRALAQHDRLGFAEIRIELLRTQHPDDVDLNLFSHLTRLERNGWLIFDPKADSDKTYKLTPKGSNLAKRRFH